MTRRFEPGQTFMVSGLSFRVVEGEKQARTLAPDLRLDVWDGSRYVPVSMGLSFFLADFHFDIEDRLYPQALGFRGGQMFLDYLSDAIAHGWRYAFDRLTRDRERKKAS